tara:strand:+ start:54966 stop:55439 length:474 start_codon:yes stop_codon:yes gene_type:complete
MLRENSYRPAGPPLYQPYAPAFDLTSMRPFHQTYYFTHLLRQNIDRIKFLRVFSGHIISEDRYIEGRKKREMSKYHNLQLHLAALKTDSWRASFDEIEDILGFTLPASARNYQAWWANQTEPSTHTHAKAWKNAGWQTKDLNLTASTVRFVRNGKAD